MGKRSARDRVRPSQIVAADKRRAEAVTVAWMLGTFATLIAESLAGSGYLLLTSTRDIWDWPQRAQVLPPLLLLIAFISGVISLLLIPLVYRFRRTPPPTTVTILAALIAVIPLITLLVLVL